METWRNHIDSNPKILFGKPIVKNTRIPVDLIVEKIAAGDSFNDLIQAYPLLKKEDISACLYFAAESVKNEIIFSKAS